MKEFRVTLTHRAGELARLTALLAERHINLRSLAGLSEANKAIICLVAEDVAALRGALEESRIPFEESEILSELLENEPGQIADLARRLGEAGVDIRSMYVLGRDDPLIEVGFTVDDPKRAKKALGA
jgi:hypothetical protein